MVTRRVASLVNGAYNFIIFMYQMAYGYHFSHSNAHITEVLFKICNANKTHLEYYLNVLGQSLTGDAEMEKALYFMAKH